MDSENEASCMRDSHGSKRRQTVICSVFPVGRCSTRGRRYRVVVLLNRCHLLPSDTATVASPRANPLPFPCPSGQSSNIHRNKTSSFYDDGRSEPQNNSRDYYSPQASRARPRPSHGDQPHSKTGRQSAAVLAVHEDGKGQP